MYKNLTLFWEEDALQDRINIFEYLADHNPIAAEKTDLEIESSAKSLLNNPERCPVKTGFKGRCLIMSKVSFLMFYDFDEALGIVRIVRILHAKQKH